MQQQALGVDQYMALLALDLLPRVIAVRIDRNPALFRAFHALAVDGCRGRTGFSFRQFPALSVERVVETIERAVVCPAAEIVVDRAPRWQVPRHSRPLTAGAQDVHKTIHQVPLDPRALVTTTLVGLVHRPDSSPLRLPQVAPVTHS